MVNRGELIVMPVSGQRSLPALLVRRVTAIPEGELTVLPRERRPDSATARGRIVDILV